jgi:hypothetical protein
MWSTSTRNFEIVHCKLCKTYVKRNLNTASTRTSCVPEWSSIITVYITYKKASEQRYLKNLMPISSDGSFVLKKKLTCEILTSGIFHTQYQL